MHFFSRKKIFPFAVIGILLVVTSLTCKGKEDPVTPGPDTFDKTRPTILSFKATRNGAPLSTNVVYSGEDIGLTVEAVSHAFPQSCGLDEGEVVENNLKYYFSAEPPQGVNAPGLFTQPSPPKNEALWRVPNVRSYDTGEGLVYNLKVKVFDECLGNESTGKLALRVFANQGAPLINSTTVQSSINQASPVTENKNSLGFYEVELGDKCRISIDADSRTSPSICSNRGIPEGEEVGYYWIASSPSLGLSFDSNPARANMLELSVPGTFNAGATFSIKCSIVDLCTDLKVESRFDFRVVARPRITNLLVQSDSKALDFDPFFQSYQVQPGMKIELKAVAEVMDDDFCNLLGKYPPLEWKWRETRGSVPKIIPEYKAFPTPWDFSVVQFIVPAAVNGTKYEFECSVTDRCNHLTDTETVKFIVIRPPDANLVYVRVDSVQKTPDPECGRYKVEPADIIEIRISAKAESDSDFCSERGISKKPPVKYTWSNPYDALVLNYTSIPSTEYCDLMFTVPEDTPSLEVNLQCLVEDMCNGLFDEVIVPFKVIKYD